MKRTIERILTAREIGELLIDSMRSKMTNCNATITANAEAKIIIEGAKLARVEVAITYDTNDN